MIKNICCSSCGYVFCEVLNKCIRPWLEDCISHRRLNKLDEFNLTELGVFVAGVCASLGALLVIIQKSKCKKINCCCIKCDRDVDAIIKEEKLKMTGHTTSPRENEKENELELNIEK
jgi:hypothetical protein